MESMNLDNKVSGVKKLVSLHFSLKPLAARIWSASPENRLLSNQGVGGN